MTPEFRPEDRFALSLIGAAAGVGGLSSDRVVQSLLIAHPSLTTDYAEVGLLVACMNVRDALRVYPIDKKLSWSLAKKGTSAAGDILPHHSFGSLLECLSGCAPESDFGHRTLVASYRCFAEIQRMVLNESVGLSKRCDNLTLSVSPNFPFILPT